MPTIDKLRIFISSTITDLTDERTTAAKAVHKMHLDAALLEDMGAMPFSSLEASLLYASQADIYILIFGERYGYIPDGETQSVTELEYLKAQELSIPTLVYVKEMATREPEEEVFLERVRKKKMHAKPFKTLAALEEHIQEDLARELSRLVLARGWEGRKLPPLRHVLVASLGRSPGAVTGLYHALKNRLGIPIDEVATISAKGSIRVQNASDKVRQTLEAEHVVYNRQEFEGTDVADEGDVNAFRFKLTEVLRTYNRQGALLYLGIAGGRTSMGALMAMVAFSDAPDASLYHLWVPDDIEKDGDITNFSVLTPEREREVLFPSKCQIVKVPFAIGKRG